jgi:hypothetical protein
MCYHDTQAFRRAPRRRSSLERARVVVIIILPCPSACCRGGLHMGVGVCIGECVCVECVCVSVSGSVLGCDEKTVLESQRPAPE